MENNPISLKKELLEEWEYATNKIVNHFAKTYFGFGADMYWVADEIGGIVYINDHFFNVRDIVDFLKHDYTKKMMFEYKEYAYKCAINKEQAVSIKHYKKSKQKHV